MVLKREEPVGYIPLAEYYEKSLISISCLQYKVYLLIMSGLLPKYEQFVSSL